MVAGGEGAGGRGQQVTGTQRYKLPVIQSGSHRVYGVGQCSTGNTTYNVVVTPYGDRRCWLALCDAHNCGTTMSYI